MIKQGFADDTAIDVNYLQEVNGLPPITVTLSGIVMELSLQPLNALSPIEVTLFGIVIAVMLLQDKNASSPIVVTLSGIVMLFKPVQP